MADFVRLNQQDFGALLRLSTRQIRTYTREGMPSSVEGNARMYGADSLAWIIEKREAAIRSEFEITSRDELELERLKHQTRQAKVNADLAEGEVIRRSDALEVFSRIIERLRTRISAVPGSWGPVLVAYDEIPSMVGALEDRTGDLLDVLREQALQELGA